MLSYLWLGRTARQRGRGTSHRKRWLSGLCWALLIGRECVALPLVPFVGPNPANPYVPVPAVGYRSVIAPYVSLRPAKPGNWQEQNQRAASQGEMPGMDMPGTKPDGHQGHQH